MHTTSPTRANLPRFSAQRNLHHADFFCQAPEARQVSIVGDFNQWHPGATLMTRQPDGCWMACLELEHGYHQFAFLVDGQRVLDPKAGRARDLRNQPVSLIAIS